MEALPTIPSVSVCVWAYAKELQYKERTKATGKENEDTGMEGDSKGAGHSWEGLQRATVLSETSDFSVWSGCLVCPPEVKFSWKQVKFRVGTQWPVLPSRGVLPPRRCFQPKEWKGKPGFSGGKPRCCSGLHLRCHPSSVSSVIPVADALRYYSVLVKPQAYFLECEVPRVSFRGQVLVSFSLCCASPRFSPL